MVIIHVLPFAVIVITHESVPVILLLGLALLGVAQIKIHSQASDKN